MGRRLVIGDIHGGYSALKQCLERSGFNESIDQLICLGDVSDGWPETRECIDQLMTIPNLVMIKGNHDSLTVEWAKTGIAPEGWMGQGGYATIDSYAGQIPDEHLKFLEEAKLYHLSDNQLFVHAGILINTSLEEQDEKIFLWDRSLYRHAFPHRLEENPPKLTPYDAIYIGHSPINRQGYLHPIQACEVWMMDTGAGWDGVLSIMDIDTQEYWTSDLMKELYPDHLGRYV